MTGDLAVERLEAHPERTRRLGGLVAVDPILAEQAEVDVADLAGRPPVEEVLAVGLDPLEHGAIDARCVGGEPSLRARDPEPSPGQQLGVIACDPVNRVALGHRCATVGGSVGRMTPVPRHASPRFSHVSPQSARPGAAGRARLGSDAVVGRPTMAGAMTLHLDAEDLNTCVACGLCLPHCPTFRATGEEGLSPRGRIDAMRAVQWRDAPIDDDFVRFMTTCVQCRGCEPACPSGVPVRTSDRSNPRAPGRARVASRRGGSGGRSRCCREHRLLLVGSTALAVAQRLPARSPTTGVGAVAAPPRRPNIPATGSDVWLFAGCVMDAWMRDTHRSTAKVLDSLGVGYDVPGDGGGCCGALHAPRRPARRDGAARRSTVMRSMPGDAPILVNSAGCGAALKDYGRLLGTDGAHRFSARVFDIHEWVASRLGDLPSPRRHGGPA